MTKAEVKAAIEQGKMIFAIGAKSQIVANKLFVGGISMSYFKRGKEKKYVKPDFESFWQYCSSYKWSTERPWKTQ